MSLPRRASRSQQRLDILRRDDIERLVRAFYARAFGDDVLGTIFVDVAKMDLGVHVPVICDFWETVLFRAGLYRRNALRPHVDLHTATPLTASHFARWLALWDSTIDDHFSGPRADMAKTQAARIAWSMRRRLAGATGSQLVSIERPEGGTAGGTASRRPPGNRGFRAER